MNSFFRIKKALALLCIVNCATCIDVSAQKAYVVSNAHLDTQWNWDIQTTIGEYVKNTMYQNLDLMKSYPDYVFNFEGAQKYQWMKEYYPERWNELCQRIEEGRWHPCGSGWDACEVMVGSPESWIRNTLMGQAFYRKEFNTECTDVFLPDCFGFPYTLPTLAHHCGLIGFSSQKLGWRHADYSKIYQGMSGLKTPVGKVEKSYPFSIGLWEGIDGSKIMMAHGFDYNKKWLKKDICSDSLLLAQCAESPLNIAYTYYGTGDIGGSPGQASVRNVCEASHDENGKIKVVSAASDQLYKDFLPYENHPELPHYKGELTMELHGNGCYTSQAAMKLYNRQNEHLGDAAERASVIADWAGVKTYPKQELLNDWRRVILHQFHDDLTGTSIPRAYEFSWNDELLSLKSFSDVLTTAVSRFAEKLDTRVDGTPIVLFNAEAFSQSSHVVIDCEKVNGQWSTVNGNYSVVDCNGKKVPSQIITDSKGKKQLIFDAEVPSCGFAVYGIKVQSPESRVQSGELTNGLENSRYKLKIDGNGDITSLFDKKLGKELVRKGEAIRLVVFDDCYSPSWPAWEVRKATLDKDPVPVHDNVSISLVEKGDVCQTLKITKHYGESEINQYITLWNRTQADRIDFRNEVEWKSLNALLKAEFPLSVSNDKASYDPGLGVIQRGNNCKTNFEVCSHEWTDLTDRSGSNGVTILNDSRYGWDKPDDNTLRLSLLYSPKAKNGYPYQEKQDFGFHQFTYSLVSHEGKFNLADATHQSAVLNSPLKPFVTKAHKGELGKEFSFVRTNNNNVIVRCVKQAENRDEYVVRVYSLSGDETQKADLDFAGEIVNAKRTDGTEKEIGETVFAGNTLKTEVKPYSLSTYKIKLSDKNLKTSKPQNLKTSLTYDKQTASMNAFTTEVDFSDAFSYAAELLPEDGKLVSGGIEFQLGKRDDKNAVLCKGQRIEVPKGYNRVYLLAASRSGDRKAEFKFNGSKLLDLQLTIPSYTGFIGQWQHEGQTTGFLKDAEVAYVGTHRHAPEGDKPYEFTYIFRFGMDVPKGAKELVLPNDDKIALFAVTFANEENACTPAERLFLTSNREEKTEETAEAENWGENLLKGAKVVDASGSVTGEFPKLLIDGDVNTKWCDTQKTPHWIDIDLGEVKEVSRWTLLGAGKENASYITRSCLLQGKEKESDEWKTLDMIDNNKKDFVNRKFDTEKVRYIRLLVISPEQGIAGSTRIYEMELYK